MTWLESTPRLRLSNFLQGMFDYSRPDRQKIDKSALSIGAILHLFLHPSSRFQSYGKPGPKCEYIEKLKSAQQNNAESDIAYVRIMIESVLPNLSSILPVK